MAFGLPKKSGADIIPALKYNAVSGRFFMADRAQDANGEWITRDIDLTSAGVQIAFLADIRSIEVGYVRFAKGAPPDFWLVPEGSPLPQPEGAGNKDGPSACVRLLVYSSKIFGEARTREVLATSMAMQDALEDVTFVARKAAEWNNTDHLPLFSLRGTVPRKNAQGATNYVPEFEVRGWYARPADFRHESRIGDAPAPKAPPAAMTGNGPASTVPAARQPAMAGGGGRAFEDDIPFGAEFR